MRWWPAAVGALGAAGVLIPPQKPAQGVSFGLIGQHAGYLSPCGCTYPMSGGLLRVAKEARRLRDQESSILLDTGDLVSKHERQDVLKAEAISQAFASLDVTAANVAASDGDLGAGEWLSLTRLADQRFVASQTSSDSEAPLKQEIQRDGYLIGGFTTKPSVLGRNLGTQVMDLEHALSKFLEDAKLASLVPVVMLDGTRDEAVEVAKRHPDIGLLTYQMTGRAPSHPMTVGPVNLVAPGERGEFFVSFRMQGSRLSDYKAVRLGPEIRDDSKVRAVYDQYLREVTREGLWAKTPRFSGPAYAGSQKCGSCHEAAYKKWLSSDHWHALRTLKEQGHENDPECILCHVTGAGYKAGFQSLAATPELAAVGCESCHGAGAAHSAKPHTVPLRMLAAQQCTSCHTKLNSPNFDFAEYWRKVRH